MSVPSPKLLVLGAGPVGTALARCLRVAGLPVLGLWGRNPESARSASATAQVLALTGDLPDAELVAQADIIVLAIRDAAISEVAGKLAEGGHLAASPIILHSSGAISAEQAFAGISSEVRGLGLLHPLRALARNAPVDSFRGTTFGIQGDSVGCAAAESLCAALGGKALPLRAEQMPGYHSAAVMASNYMVALMDAALTMAEATGLDPEMARSGFLDLAQGALAGVASDGCLPALTGPIRRGDLTPIAGHLQAIEANLPTATDLYREMGRWTLAMARRSSSATEAELTAIEGLLDGEG